jgi:hypothetical protein
LKSPTGRTLTFLFKIISSSEKYRWPLKKRIPRPLLIASDTDPGKNRTKGKRNKERVEKQEKDK